MTDARVRAAEPDDLPAVMNVLDAAMLQEDADAVRERMAAGDVLVAVAGDRVLGAVVLDGGHIAAVAVRPGRRDQGIGTALVSAARDDRGALTAGFHARVKPFYESLGFVVEPADDEGRYRGYLPARPGDPDPDDRRA